MLPGSLLSMKYWTYFIVKLAVIAGFMSLVWKGFHAIWPEPLPFMRVRQAPFAHDLGYTFAVLIFSLICVGLVHLSILDQRYRCRACLRRLRMPLTYGSWNHIFLRPPRTDYICPYGHGTLRVPDVHFTSPEHIDWRPIDDMWKELYDLEESKK